MTALRPSSELQLPLDPDSQFDGEVATRRSDRGESSASGAILVNAEAETRLDSALRELREALHRHGRLSSRNEALDEVACLIFAHSASIRSGGDGISTSLIANGNTARNLKAFVERHGVHIPRSLSYETSHIDFRLHLKDEENLLAKEIIVAFQHLDAERMTTDAISGYADLINHAFGRFLADTFANEKELGQYLTPTEVVQFMVDLALSELTKSERAALSSSETFNDFGLVLDPSCGVGSFLAEFVRRAHVTVAPGDPTWSAEATRQLVVGIDKSERMIRLALANLATFGADSANLHLANGLARRSNDGHIGKAIEGEVGLILTNPPFGATFQQKDLPDYRLGTSWATKKPKTIDSELLFFERYLDWLRPGGQLLAVVPDSILTNKGLFADLRRALAPDIDIQTVVSLPPVTFAAAGTATKTSILHLRKNGAAGTHARFAICKDIGYSVSARGAQRKKVRESAGDLPRILHGLVTGSYQDHIRVVADVEKSERWDAGYHASLPLEFLQRIDANESLLLVSEIADLVSDRVDPRRGGAPTFQYIEISDVDGATLSVTSKTVPADEAPSRARRSVRAGDILVSTVRPERGAIGVVPAQLDGAVCTTGFAVLRPREVEPLVAASLLRTDFVTQQLLRNNVGIAYPAIEASCLPDVVLPVDRRKIHQLSEAARAYAAARDAVQHAAEVFASQLAAALD